MTNKEIAWSYFELIGEGRIEDAQALLHDAVIRHLAAALVRPITLR
jgi:hypothetical protein